MENSTLSSHRYGRRKWIVHLNRMPSRKSMRTFETHARGTSNAQSIMLGIEWNSKFNCRVISTIFNLFRSNFALIYLCNRVDPSDSSCGKGQKFFSFFRIFALSRYCDFVAAGHSTESEVTVNRESERHTHMWVMTRHNQIRAPHSWCINRNSLHLFNRRHRRQSSIFAHHQLLSGIWLLLLLLWLCGSLHNLSQRRHNRN